MAVKTFTAGESATAADTNTYLANAGLVYITEATATSGTTLSVNNCFTSTYAAYVLHITGSAASANYGIDLRLRASGSDTSTGYYYGITRVDMAAAAINVSVGNNSTLMVTGAIVGSAGRGTTVAQITNPQLAQYTSFSFQATDIRAMSGYGGITSTGQLTNTTQYDGFTLLLGGGSGTISNMQVKIYGYRQA
jgi:hypothetical protein